MEKKLKPIELVNRDYYIGMLSDGNALKHASMFSETDKEMLKTMFKEGEVGAFKFAKTAHHAGACIRYSMTTSGGACTSSRSKEKEER